MMIMHLSLAPPCIDRMYTIPQLKKKMMIIQAQGPKCFNSALA